MRRAARIWQFFAAGACLPWRLPFALSAGCLLLLGLFLVPPTQFNDVPPLLEERKREAGGNQGRARDEKIETRQIPVQVVGMEAKGGMPDATEEDERAARLQRERVGTNILIRSGYLKSAAIRIDASLGLPAQISYRFEIDPAARSCAALDDEAAGADPLELRQMAARLAIVAVAVEKFHRTALHRNVEWAYANIFRRLSGRLPDLSLGPAQIRPSRIRQIAAEVGERDGPYKLLHLSDVELADVLRDECRSLKLSAALMHHFLRKASQCGKGEGSVNGDDGHCPVDPGLFAARSYVGQRRTTSAIIDYAPIVAVMVDWLSN